MITITRPATPGDAATIGAVHAACWAETYAGLVPEALFAAMTDPARRADQWRAALHRGDCVHVAVASGRILGFGAAGPARDARLGAAAEVGAIYLLKAAQRHGLGRMLMRDLAGRQLALGRGSLGLWVLDTNAPARGFYARLGGQEGAVRAQEGFTDIAVTWADAKRLLPAAG